MKNGKFMNCRFVQSHLLGYIENSLPANIQSEVKDHINSCSLCSVLCQNVKDTYLIPEKVTKPQIDPFFATRTIAKYKNQEAVQADVYHRIYRVFQPVAASILVLLGIGAGIYLGQELAIHNTLISNSVKVESNESYSAEFITVSADQDLAVLLDNE